MKPKDGFKVKIALQSTLDPIQAQAKKAFVNAVCAINQASIIGSNHPKALTDHPDISQASRNQHAAEPNRIGQVALVNIEAAAFLVREEGFDLKATPIKTTGLISIGHIGYQKDGLFVATAPPANQIERYGGVLCEADLRGDGIADP